MQAKCILKCCQIVDLVKILKSKEDPWDMFRFLLKDICTTFPAQDSSQDGTFVRVSCPWEEASAVSVSPDGFVLLEAAEGAMESTEQVLEVVQVDVLRFHLLSDVGSRVARQQDKNVNSRVVVRSWCTARSVLWPFPFFSNTARWWRLARRWKWPGTSEGKAGLP